MMYEYPEMEITRFDRDVKANLDIVGNSQDPDNTQMPETWE